MKAIQIASLHNVHESRLSRIRHGKEHTDDIALALDLGKLTGNKPIGYIRPKLRKLVLAAHPELGRKVSVHAPKVAKSSR